MGYGEEGVAGDMTPGGGDDLVTDPNTSMADMREFSGGMLRESQAGSLDIVTDNRILAPHMLPELHCPISTDSTSPGLTGSSVMVCVPCTMQSFSDKQA